MNGIEKITARITAEANEAAAAVIAEAEKTAGEIRAAYQKKADEAYEARMNEGNTEVRLGAEREQRAAKLQSRKDTLALKQSILERAYGRAKESSSPCRRENIRRSSRPRRAMPPSPGMNASSSTARTAPWARRSSAARTRS